MTLSNIIITITFMQQVDKKNLIIFGKIVKSLRLKTKLSLNEFVLKHGFLTTATWSRIENGCFDIKFSTLLRIAKMLDIDVCDLLKRCNFDNNFIDD